MEEVKKIVEQIRENTYYTEEVEEKVDGKKKKVVKEFPISQLYKKLFHLNSQTRVDFKTEVVPKEDQTYEKLTKVLNNSFRKYEIKTCIRKIHFFAQMYWETQYFTKTIEGDPEELSYDPYRGRGFIHLTFKRAYDEYNKYSKKIMIDGDSVDVVTEYGKVASNLDVAADTSSWFWAVYKKAEFNKASTKATYKEILDKSLNEIADFGDKYIDLISKLLSGGSALDKRRSFYTVFKNIMDYEGCVNKK